MRTSEALWEVFKATGHIGVYLLYKEYLGREKEAEEMIAVSCPGCLENAQAE